jgi:UDP-N-acetylglucosamine 2-epimerase (non-hydrolysing)
LRRPSNVDEAEGLRKIMQTLQEIARRVPVLFPVHPRTRQRLQQLQLEPGGGNLRLSEPIGYLDFLALQGHAAVVITDSGGIQEETTFLQVPCLTVRENTERPITITAGTNQLVGQDMDRLRQEVARLLNEGPRAGQVPPLWDGHASERIATLIAP